MATPAGLNRPTCSNYHANQPQPCEWRMLCARLPVADSSSTLFFIFPADYRHTRNPERDKQGLHIEMGTGPEKKHIDTELGRLAKPRNFTPAVQTVRVCIITQIENAAWGAGRSAQVFACIYNDQRRTALATPDAPRLQETQCALRVGLNFTIMIRRQRPRHSTPAHASRKIVERRLGVDLYISIGRVLSSIKTKKSQQL